MVRGAAHAANMAFAPPASGIRERGAAIATSVLSAAAVIVLYYWAVRATGDPSWYDDQGGYYCLLARGLASGRLYLPLKPDPALVALPNPWDPAKNQGLGMHDLAFFHGRYYLYHGVVPAVLLFTPWRLLTGRDLPQRVAVLVLCTGGYLFSCALMLLLLRRMDLHPPISLLAVFLVMLGVCQSVPFLLQRAVVYEVAIAGGYFCLSGAFYLLGRALSSGRRRTALFAASGLLFGLAPGCRPHLAVATIVAGIAVVVVVRRGGPVRAALRSREFTAFIVPVAFCAAALAAYNYARFGNPAEFGQRYQIGGAAYQNVSLALKNVVPGIYYLIFCLPEFTPVFPYAAIAFRPPLGLSFALLPSRYFLEPTTGIFALCPAAMAAFMAPFIARRREMGALFWSMLLFSVGCALFIAGLGLTSHRFEVDFAPALLPLGAVALAALWLRADGLRGILIKMGIMLLLAYGIAVALAIGIQGPYDEFLQHNPRAFVALAKWFSPFERLRPTLNPRLEAEALFEFQTATNVTSWPLMAAGRFGSRVAIQAELINPNRLRIALVSGSPGDRVTAEASLLRNRPNRMRMEFSPGSRTLLLEWNGERVLAHRLAYLVTAPDQFTIGEDRSEVSNVRTFIGRMQVIRKVVLPSVR
jgi:hypothetical protein